MIYNVSTLEQKIDNYLENIPFNEPPLTLFNPIKYIISIGGKRLRPVLTLLSANLFTDDVSSIIAPAVGIEIFHNFSLLHDDLMDKADMRRGHQTVHKKWNDNTAILSGDAMLIEAYKHIINVEPHLIKPVLNLFSETATEVCRGQQYDMDFETRIDVTEQEYLEMIRLKTAVLIACSLKVGAIAGNASAKDADLLYQFGINVGLAFQLKDDLLDVYGDTKIFGKNIGGDILSNKKTFFLIKALEKSDQHQRQNIIKWIECVDFNPTDKINAVKNIYDDLNLKDITENFIEKYYIAALECFSNLNISDTRKKELLLFTENLMNRER